MYLVPGRLGDHTSRFYQKKILLTRPESLPYIFRKLRIHRHLSKKALGEKFGFSEQYITGVEDGSRFASIRYCLLCADLFNANPRWVKGKWAHEAIERFSSRVNGRLGLDG